MRTPLGGTLALASVMFVVTSCGLLKKKGEEDAGVEASVAEPVVDAAPEPAPPALATNEGDIARLPDETPLDNVVATTQSTFNVREAPPAGAVIGQLPKGTAVTQIAKREQFFLILWDDANAPGTKLMGWIHQGAFTVAPPQDAGPLTCKAGEIALFGDTPICGKVCSKDGDCPSGQACKGQANKLLANGKAGDGVTVCTVFHPHDAGAPTSDAGKLVPIFRLDAGKLGTLVDAGTPPAPAKDVVAATGGQCPSGFLLVTKTGKCHRQCTTSTDKTECKNRPYFCVKCDKTKKVCADSKDQCAD